MSDISLSERASFGNISSQSHTGTQPKFQPVRVKALLDFCESDDEESEGRTQESDLESDVEDLGTLPQNDSGENVFDTSFKCVKSPTVRSKVTIRRSSGKEVEETNGSSKPKCKDESTISSTNSSVPLIAYPNKNTLDTYSDNKEINKEEHEKFVNVSTAANIGSSSKDIVLENDGVIQPHEHKAFKSDKISNSDLPKDHHPCYEDTKERGGHEEASNIESGRHVPPVVNEEHNPNKIPSGISLSNVPSNSHNINSKYESFRKCSSSSDEQQHEHLSTDTPLKQLHMGAARPIPCHSRRNLNTPQNKMPADLAKSHVQTPATILSHSLQSIIGRTPLQPRNMSSIDSLQTPKTLIYGPNAPMHDTPRYFSRETKSARKPLADASPFVQNDILAYPLDSKARSLQGPQLSRPEVTPQSQNKASFNNQAFMRSNTVKRALDISEKPVPLDLQRNVVLKENRPSNLEDPERKERSNQAKAPEVRPSSNLNTCKESKPLPQESQVPSAASDAQSKQQGLRQIANKASNVQFTVPSMISKTKPSETIIVKGREYLILGTLGKGMSGEVLRVQDLTTFELCAIKCVNLSRMDKDSVQGCLEEISMLHKLQAPCIVKIFDNEIKYPMVYVVMEMGDTDLSHLLKSMSIEKHLPLTMILYYWTEMLVAVKHIHDNGVIHSDLKPANFLLVRGRLKLIDFGIASSMNADMTSVVKNCPIGTLNYISPEALMDIGGNSDSPNHNLKYKINFKSDVWSLGCILYGLVYGHTPFQHIRQQWAKVNAITNPKPNISFPTVLPGGASAQNPVYVPPILIDVMRKCLQHDPKARPTVAQLLQIQYIPIKPERTVTPAAPNFPTNMLLQAKQALNEEEWRRLTELLEKVRLS